MGSQLKRKLAVPIALGGFGNRDDNRMIRTLKISDDASEDARVLLTLATNRMMLKNLARDIEAERITLDPDDIAEELDFINASIRIGLLEISEELDQIPTSEQLFELAIS
jgi:alpha-galactosidase/6-phospho-beta-glucosidase family protein